MAFIPGNFNKWTYVFASGSVDVYAPNFEYRDLALHLKGILAAEDAGSQAHTPNKTKHQTLGALTSITNP